MMAQQTKSGRTQRGAFVDDRLWEVMRREAFERRCSVSDVLNELLAEALAAREAEPAVAAVVAAATALLSEDPTTAAGDGVAVEALRETVATYERRAGASRWRGTRETPR